MSDDEKPTWLAGSTVVWEEDDCTTSDPDHETLRIAWKRLYDAELKDEVLVEVYDGGDMDARLHANGRISISSYRGNCAIRQAHGTHIARGAPVVPLYSPTQAGERSEKIDKIRGAVRHHVAQLIEAEAGPKEVILWQLRYGVEGEGDYQVARAELERLADLVRKG